MHGLKQKKIFYTSCTGGLAPRCKRMYNKYHDIVFLTQFRAWEKPTLVMICHLYPLCHHLWHIWLRGQQIPEISFLFIQSYHFEPKVILLPVHCDSWHSLTWPSHLPRPCSPNPLQHPVSNPHYITPRLNMTVHVWRNRGTAVTFVKNQKPKGTFK